MSGGGAEAQRQGMPTRQLPMPPGRPASAHAPSTIRQQPRPPPRSPGSASRARPLPQAQVHQAPHKALPQAPQKALPKAPMQGQRALPQAPHKALPTAPHGQAHKALPQRPQPTPPARGPSPAVAGAVASAAARHGGHIHSNSTGHGSSSSSSTGHGSSSSSTSQGSSSSTSQGSRAGHGMAGMGAKAAARAVGSPEREDEVAEELKEKIAAQALDVEELRMRIEEGGGSAALRRELEEGEMLLQALYANLQALAEQRQAAAEAARQDADVSVLVEMRSRVAAQVLQVENCRTDVLNCSGSYEEKLAAQKRLEEHLMLLEALQANLEALQGSCGVRSPSRRPTRQRSGTETLKKLGSRISSFSFRQAPQDVTLSAPRPGRAASHAPPVAAASPPMVRPMRSGSALATVENVEEGEDAPAQRKANRLVHTTSKVDDITSQTKKRKKRARIAHEADDEKSSVGAKKKFYCCLCACEDFEVSPPPKPENCRNCKHEFQAHRLHQIKGVRLDRELFKNCIKAQLSFFI